MGPRLRDLECKGKRMDDKTKARIGRGDQIANGVVKLAVAEGVIKTLDLELERARRLAAKLEEVVAMRTAVLEALVEWGDGDPYQSTPPPRPAPQLFGILDWARAQLSEVP